jgi:FixJ family two-component response regulator
MTLGIVDDDEDVRRALARLLISMGHAVHVFASAEDFEAHTVALDCLILDVRLPGLSGPELRERLNGRSSPLPVVFITGDSGHKARSYSASNETPTVTKPFDVGTLMTAVDHAISSAEVVRKRHAH